MTVQERRGACSKDQEAKEGKRIVYVAKANELLVAATGTMMAMQGESGECCKGKGETASMSGDKKSGSSCSEAKTVAMNGEAKSGCCSGAKDKTVAMDGEKKSCGEAKAMTVAADGEKKCGSSCSEAKTVAMDGEKKCGSSCGSEKTVAASGRRNAPSATRRKWRDTRR